MDILYGSNRLILWETATLYKATTKLYSLSRQVFSSDKEKNMIL